MRWGITILILVSISLGINIIISNDVKWKKRADYRWDKDCKNIIISNLTYLEGTLDDCRIKLGNTESKKWKSINYVIAQEKYYSNK